MPVLDLPTREGKKAELTTMFLTFFPRFYLKKTLSNAKYKYVKIQRKIFLEDDLAMIFIDFGLLHSL